MQREVNRAGDCWNQEFGGVDRGQRCEAYPVTETVGALGGGLDRQPGFADPARPNQREEGLRLDQFLHLLDFRLPPDKAGEIDRQIGGGHLQPEAGLLTEGNFSIIAFQIPASRCVGENIFLHKVSQSLLEKTRQAAGLLVKPIRKGLRRFPTQHPPQQDVDAIGRKRLQFDHFFEMGIQM